MRFRSPDKNNTRESGNNTDHKPTLRLKLASVLMLFAASGAAWGAQPICKPDVISRPAPIEPGPDGPAIELEGDQVESVGEDTVTLKGNATMKRGAQAMEGDELTYYRKTGEIEGEGDLTFYSEEGDRIEASYLRMDIETRIGEADDVAYRIARRNPGSDNDEDEDRLGFGNQDYDAVDEPDTGDDEQSDSDGEAAEGDVEEETGEAKQTRAVVRARGTAKKAYMEGHDVTRMVDVTYTTCNEGDDSVMLSAEEITLDQGTGRGLAKNMKVKFKGVPIFYFPRLSFPINDERKTGFLFPTVGAQEGSGFVLGTPFYWNIAPNYDFTLYPRVYTKRGVQVGGEFRYLTDNSEGVLYGEYLPSDSEFGSDRSAFHLEHDHEFTDRISGDVDVQHVSDEEYLDDFSNDIEISSATYLPQQAELNYGGENWDFELAAFSYQIIDDNIPETSEPYDRLPQFTAEAEYDVPYEMEFEFEGEAVNFRQSALDDGWRFDATPSLKREFETVWGYFEPKASIRHTTYSLDRANGQDDNPSRTLPVFSADSGIYLERRTSWLGESAIHTLEPRLFYVYIPKENQDEFPNFDTGANNLNNFNNMFREYRFYGADRVGDTNQVTAGLTSRLLDGDSGNELMTGSVGMIFFLEDRDVNLDPNQTQTEGTSDFLAEFRAQVTDDWRTYAFAQWDTDENEVREGKFDVSYEPEERRYIDFSYRFSRNSTEQLRIDSVWRVLPRWHLLFEDRYSLRDKENLETSVGVEYSGCCWAVRGYFQRRAESDSTFRNAIIFELELSGLANIRAGY